MPGVNADFPAPGSSLTPSAPAQAHPLMLSEACRKRTVLGADFKHFSLALYLPKEKHS